MVVKRSWPCGCQCVPYCRASLLEKERREVGQVLPPQGPHVALIGDFREGVLHALGIQVGFELTVHADEHGGGTAGDPKQLDLSG